jgi:hypothetical protein
MIMHARERVDERYAGQLRCLLLVRAGKIVYVLNRVQTRIKWCTYDTYSSFFQLIYYLFIFFFFNRVTR